jgi:hypothetical protein
MFVNRSISGRMGQVILSMAFFGALTVTVTRAQTPSTAFTQPFNWTTKKLIILPSLNQGLFKVGEPVTLFTSNNIPVTVYDLYGRTVYAGAPTTRNFAVGHYFVECNGDRNQFGVLPGDYAGASFLCDMGYSGYLDGDQRQQRVQPGWVRVGAGIWRTVQPASGVWNWTNMDIAMANNASRKILAIASSDGPPAWVQPANLTSNYVLYLNALMQRYQGQIAAVEIWNEPTQEQFWSDPNWLNRLADLHRAGSVAISAINSNVLVLGPTPDSAGFVAGSAALAAYGASNIIDGLSWHDYWAYKFPPDQNMSTSTQFAPDVLGRSLAHREAAGFNGPVYISETGFFGQSSLGIPTPPIDPSYVGGIVTNAPHWSVGMTRGIKNTVLYRAAGAELINPHLLTLGDYSLTDGQNALYGWEYGGRGPEPKTTAFLMSCYWLNGAKLADYRTLGGRIFLFAWQRTNNTSLVIAWAREGQSVTLSNHTAFTKTDIYGTVLPRNTLDIQPVLIHGNSPNATGLLASVMANVAPLNLPPVIAFLPNQTVLRDRLLQFAIAVVDPDHEPMSYSASALPAGASLNPTTGQFSWTPTGAQAGTYTVTFTVTDARGLSAATTILISALGTDSDGLIGWWKLDETSGAVAADSGGTASGELLGFNFTPSSGWQTGRVSNALAFDGIDDYVNLDSSLLSVTNNFTISAWINPAAARTNSSVYFSLRSKYASSGILFAIRANNDLIIEGQTATGWKQIYHALGQIQNNVWQHLVVVYDKSAFAVYINGIRVPPAHTHPGYWDGDIVMNPVGVTRIGAEGEGVPNYFFKGRIDDVRVYNRTLSQAEVTAAHLMAIRPRPPSNLTVVGR